MPDPDLDPQPVEQAMGWQPIETAPKDETRVSIFDPEKGVVGDALFGHPYGDHHTPGWFDAYGWSEDPSEHNAYNPTHWMPLPPPPKENLK